MVAFYGFKKHCVFILSQGHWPTATSTAANNNVFDSLESSSKSRGRDLQGLGVESLGYLSKPFRRYAINLIHFYLLSNSGIKFDLASALIVIIVRLKGLLFAAAGFFR